MEVVFCYSPYTTMATYHSDSEDEYREPAELPPSATVGRIRKIFQKALEETAAEADASDHKKARATDRKVLGFLEAIGTAADNVVGSRNPQYILTQCHAVQRSTQYLAGLLPAWRQLQWGARGLHCQLEAERQINKEVQAALQRMTDVAERERASKEKLQDELRRATAEMEKLTFQVQPTAAVVRLNTPRAAPHGTPSPSATPHTIMEPEVLMDTDEEETEEGPRPILLTLKLPPRQPTIISRATLQCAVCLKMVPRLLKFRCQACKTFWNRLIEREKRPDRQLETTCRKDHPPNQPSTCIHCRRLRYEQALLQYDPKASLPIPSLTGHPFFPGASFVSEGADSRKEGGCKPPELEPSIRGEGEAAPGGAGLEGLFPLSGQS